MRRRFLGLVLLGAIAAAGLYVYTARTGASAEDTATPRLSNGHPDLNGYWYRRLPPLTAVRKEGESIILDPDAPRDHLPPCGHVAALLPGLPRYKPGFLERVKALQDKQVQYDPAYTCGPPGVPRIGPPQRIIQTERELAILYDDLNGNFWRVVPTDGRPHRTSRPPNVPGHTDPLPVDPSPHGDSVGRWEGDTLVIDVRNLADDTWLGDDGLFHTANTRVIERLTREGDTLTWQATVEDPGVLAEPWKMNPRTLTLRPDDEIEEAAFCEDRDMPIKQDLSHHRNTR
jgi:hypothetical protein